MRTFPRLLGACFLLIVTNAAAEDAPAKNPEPLEEAKTESQVAAQEAGIKGAESGGPAKYGPAGCGLGSLIFARNSGFTQIFAGTSNFLFATQSFGISSGTSNCDTGAGNSNSTRAFVQTNRAALAKDIARGRGETISNLSALAGCSDAKAVGIKLQRSYRSIFSSAKASDVQVSDSLVNVLGSDQSLGCTNLG